VEPFSVRCPICKHVLFVAHGLGGPPIEIKCHRCNVTVRWPATIAEVAEQAPKQNTVQSPSPIEGQHS
jgi:phage FluMu protein Com